MVTIKNIEDRIRDDFWYVDRTDGNMDALVKYITGLIYDTSGNTLVYDNLSLCAKCLTDGRESAPSVVKTEHKEGMCGSWYNDYHVECMDCHNKSEKFHDWGQDGEKLAIIDWNNKN